MAEDTASVVKRARKVSNGPVGVAPAADEGRKSGLAQLLRHRLRHPRFWSQQLRQQRSHSRRSAAPTEGNGCPCDRSARFGQSSWFKRNNITPLPATVVRLLLFDDPQEQALQDLVFSNLRSMLKARPDRAPPFELRSTPRTSPPRAQQLDQAGQGLWLQVQAVFFDVPFRGLPWSATAAGTAWSMKGSCDGWRPS